MMKTSVPKMKFNSKQKRVSKKLLQKIFSLMDCIDTRLGEYINTNEEDLEKLIKNSLNISKVIPDLLKVSQLLLPVVEPEESAKKNYLLDSINQDSETKSMVENLIMKLSGDNLITDNN